RQLPGRLALLPMLIEAEPMSGWKTVDLPRRGLLLFCPRRFCHSGVVEISVDELRSAGIDAVLLDLDNTLVKWQRHEVPDEVLEWLNSLRAAGMKLCLISNTRFGRRLKALSEELGIPFVRRAWK